MFEGHAPADTVCVWGSGHGGISLLDGLWAGTWAAWRRPYVAACHTHLFLFAMRWSSCESETLYGYEGKAIRLSSLHELSVSGLITHTLCEGVGGSPY